MPSDPQDFSLRPFQEKARPEAQPRMVDEEEGLDEAYPVGGSASEAADGGVPRRKKRNTARLVWDSKPKRAPNPKNLGFQIAEVVVPNPGEAGPRLPLEPATQEVDTHDCNRLIWGDNLMVMQALLAQGYEGRINLIYIDPPYDSAADYGHRITLEDGPIQADMSALERLAYRDTWEGGLDSYLDMLAPRLHLMKRLLSEDGAIYVQCDENASHYIKVLMDEVFGRTCFQRELIWRIGWISGYKSAACNWIRNHDTILMYAKNTDRLHFTKQYIPYPEGYVRRDGAAPTGKGYPIEDVWNASDLDRLDSIQIMSFSGEKVGYDTQKNENLVSRILLSSSSPNDLVADFFCGSGTTAAVAEKLGRRWITSDLGKASLQVTRNRLVRLGTEGSGGIAFQRPDGRTRCAPFVVENLGNYQRQMIYLSDTRLRQVGPLVLTLFGAQPHPQERNLGTQAYNDAETGRFQRRLVLVGDPDRPLSAKRVAEAVALLKTLDGGGYSKLVALGWDFELNFDASLQRLLGSDISKVEPRLIPTDIIEHLKKIPEGAGPEDREVERLREKVAFFEKPWLGQPSVQALGWVERDGEHLLRVQVRLTRYLLRSVPAGLKGFEKLSDQEKTDWLKKAGGPDGLSLIDFWCLDDDLGGEDGKRPFTSTWQDLRGLGKRVRRVATATEILIKPRPGRRLGLRLVDVFGNDAAWSGLLPEG
jgi:DNA modification methylase